MITDPPVDGTLRSRFLFVDGHLRLSISVYSQSPSLLHFEESVAMLRMMFTRFPFVFLLLIVSCPACFSQVTVNGLKKNFDENDDGVIQKSEAGNQLLKNFDRIDTNGDDQLSSDELQSLVQRLKEAGNGRGRNNQRQRVPVVPENVTLQQDVVYRPNGSEKWKLDIAYPKNEPPEDSPRRAAIVFIHGGGWKSGDKGGGLWRSLPLQYAEKGYVCISVNYRLLDEAPFPACIEDCRNAVRWLRANADRYHVDPERIGAYGNSAGAHLVSLLGLCAKDAGLDGDGSYPEFSGSVQCVVCSAPPTNFLNWDGKSDPDPRRLQRLFATDDLEKAKDKARQCSPVTYVRSGVPFLVIHGTADRTVPVFQGDSFVEALKGVEADVTYLRIKGAGHGVFGQAGKRTQPAMEKFFQRTLSTASPNE